MHLRPERKRPATVESYVIGARMFPDYCADTGCQAFVRLLLETALRAGEVLGLGTTDVDVVAGLAVVRRGKGGRGRAVPFGPHTGRAIDRWWLYRFLAC